MIGRMPPRQRTGLTLTSPDVQQILDLADYAESRGYDDLWFADSGGVDSLTLVPAVAERTNRVRIGTAIVPVYTRSSAVLAATCGSIQHFAAGRFILGLGSSSQMIMGSWSGVEVRLPLTRVSETVELTRQMLAGEKTNFDGKTISSHGFRMPGLDPPVPIYMAALRGKMLEAAAEVGDGVIVNLFPHDALPMMMEHVAAGARRAGKDPAEVEVADRHQVCVTDDVDRARNLFRKRHAPYYANPVYNKLLVWAGYDDVAKEIEEGWAERSRERTTRALTDELIDQICIFGSKAYCQDRIREYAAGGIHVHIIAPVSEDPGELQATLDAFTADEFAF